MIDDLEALIRSHNNKCAPAPTYVPSSHGVREVRQWELANGVKWYALSPTSRRRANEDIAAMKQSSAS